MAIIAFAVSAGYLVFKKIQKRKVTQILPIVSGSAFLVFLLWLNPVTRFRVIEEPLITTYQADRSVTNWNSVSFRLLEWKGSWSVIRSNWIAGVGTGGGKLAMENFYKHYNNSTIGLEHNAHNQYLQTWMESGLTGLFVFLSCVFMGVFRLYKDASYVSFILIFSLMCLTESIGERQKGIMFFTLFQTLFLGIQKKSE
jgi:O-antigen ligase